MYAEIVGPSSGSNVIPKRDFLGLDGLRPHKNREKRDPQVPRVKACQRLPYSHANQDPSPMAELL